MRVGKALVLIFCVGNAPLLPYANSPSKSVDEISIAKSSEPGAENLPSIVSQPHGTGAYFGGQAVFSVTVSSAAPVTFQWFRDAVEISGRTSGTLTLEHVGPSDAAHYYVEVSNQFGTVRSDSVPLILHGGGPISVTTLAGSPTPDFKDAATGSEARFNGPNSLAIQPDGTIVIPEGGNHAIRLLDPSGAVATLAGKGPLAAGVENGPGTMATFNVPLGVAIDRAQNIFVADAYNNVIRKIEPQGVRMVTTHAGTGEPGFHDGPGAEAKFNFPNDMVVDPEGNLYLTEFQGHRVRKVGPDGTVSTWAGTGAPGYHDGPGDEAQFNQPAGLARDTAGNIYVTEWVNHTIRKITPGRVVSTIAGTVGQSGLVDGPALTTARLNTPDGIAADGMGNLFFTEWGNSTVRLLSALGDVLTLVGTAGTGFRDGGRSEAQMLQPAGLAVHPDGSLIVSDTYNNTIRKLVWQAGPAHPTEAMVLIELNPSITIFGVPGKTYLIESTESLVSPHWKVLGEVTLQNAVETWFDSQPVTRAKRFYRAVLKE